MVVIIQDLMWCTTTLKSSINQLPLMLSKKHGIVGYTDWRLPSLKELIQLVQPPVNLDTDYCINSQHFPDVGNYDFQFYLTSTYRSDEWVYTVDFWNGNIAYSHINEERCVRLCRNFK